MAQKCISFQRIMNAASNSKPSSKQVNEWITRERQYIGIGPIDERKFHNTSKYSALTGWDGRTVDIENIQWTNSYAEPGYSDPDTAILFADWNSVSNRVQNILERSGFELEWEDEWSTCNDCGKAVRTSADSYSWQPYYVILNECEFVCIDCIVDNGASDYLESLENNPRTALNTTDINPADSGYTLLPETYENGFHPDMSDDPKRIYETLSERYNRILFQIHEQSQFYISFRVWFKIDFDACVNDAVDTLRDIQRAIVSDDNVSVEQYEAFSRMIKYLEHQVSDK